MALAFLRLTDARGTDNFQGAMPTLRVGMFETETMQFPEGFAPTCMPTLRVGMAPDCFTSKARFLMFTWRFPTETHQSALNNWWRLS
jgi:hypothetical protein